MEYIMIIPNFSNAKIVDPDTGQYHPVYQDRRSIDQIDHKIEITYNKRGGMSDEAIKAKLEEIRGQFERTYELSSLYKFGTSDHIEWYEIAKKCKYQIEILEMVLNGTC